MFAEHNLWRKTRGRLPLVLTPFWPERGTLWPHSGSELGSAAVGGVSHKAHHTSTGSVQVPHLPLHGGCWQQAAAHEVMPLLAGWVEMRQEPVSFPPPPPPRQGTPQQSPYLLLPLGERSGRREMAEGAIPLYMRSLGTRLSHWERVLQGEKKAR